MELVVGNRVVVEGQDVQSSRDWGLGFSAFPFWAA